MAERNPYPLVSIQPTKCTDRSLSPTCNKLPANHNLIQEQTANHNWFTEENWKDNYTVGRGGGEGRGGAGAGEKQRMGERETGRVMKRSSEDSLQMFKD